ncbi:hypothetical protein M501DRAFT_999246 [Patellaria atrata CBS 101060]|uniref:Uncharacterized protein n=1 Tax=Patellaria atrata CBS 101060 TaxID=1346257 RepID=A0A9P4S371_9PEZI|nr:hypothetical protein M501DRAFT_999246 [Patellaria atrata CBS 101060]
MNHIVALQKITTRDRWPKPLEPTVAGLARLFDTAISEAREEQRSQTVIRTGHPTQPDSGPLRPEEEPDPVKRMWRERAEMFSKTSASSISRPGISSTLTSTSSNLNPGPSMGPPNSTSANAHTQENPKTLVSSALKETHTLISLTLSKLHDERQAWWASKSAQRRAWEEAGEVQKLTRLQVVNQKTAEMIADARARVGAWGRYGLGLEGGMAEGRV